MINPTAADVAACAVALASGDTILYVELDCHAFVEKCVNDIGGRMSFAGSNDMARNAVSWLGTLAEARRQGKLVVGAGLFIRADDGGEPAKYQADGLGNFSHVGLYVGENALTDVDQNGESRACDAVHSSQSMGRVAGSTLANGWTHVGLFRAVNYGATASDGGAQATVFSDNREPVRVRPTPSTQKPWIALRPVGTKVTVCGWTGDWARVSCDALGGKTGYMQRRFLCETDETTDPTQSEGTLLMRVAELEKRLYAVDTRLAALEGGM